MTTIVADFRKKIMVSDTRCTYGGTQFQMQKIHQMPDGTLLGFSGSVTEATKFVDWWQSGQSKAKSPDFGEEPFDALSLSEKGIFLWDSSLVPTQIHQDFFAVGSGAAYALGALRAGASAEDSVTIATLEDQGSGLPLDCRSYIKQAASKKKPTTKSKPSVGGRSSSIDSKKAKR